MKPLDFPLSNCMFAEDQDEYENLPAFRDSVGRVVSCWKLTWIERLKVLCFGKLWLSQLTFNRALQPQLPSVDCPVDFPKFAEDQDEYEPLLVAQQEPR